MDYREANNRDRQIEYRTFISLYDYVESDEKLYFANTNYNALVIVDKMTRTVERMIPFEREERAAQNLHLRCVEKAGKICFLPAQAQCIHVYDIEKGEQFTYNISDRDMRVETKEIWNYFVYGDQIYLLPGSSSQKLHLWNDQTNTFEVKEWWNIPLEKAVLGHDGMDEKCLYSFVKESNQLYITNFSNQTIEEFFLPDEHIQYVTYDGQNFWYVGSDIPDIVCWNKNQGVVERYRIRGDIHWEYGLTGCIGIRYIAGNLFLFFYENYQKFALSMLDKTGRRVKIIHSIECERGEFSIEEMEPNLKKVGNRLICLLKNAGEVVCVDLNKLECRQYVEKFYYGVLEQKYVYDILIDKGALLYEEPGAVGLDMLIQHYINKRLK